MASRTEEAIRTGTGWEPIPRQKQELLQKPEEAELAPVTKEPIEVEPEQPADVSWLGYVEKTMASW